MSAEGLRKAIEQEDELRRRVVAWMHERSMNRTQLAQHLGVSLPRVSTVLNGNRSVNELVTLANSLGIQCAVVHFFEIVYPEPDE